MINFEAIDGVITPLKGQDKMNLEDELKNMIEMGTETLYVSEF